MLRDVEMQDTPAIVADNKETVEDAERDRGHGEEVHRRNRFPVMLKKRAPTLGWPGISRRPLHPAGDGSLGDVKAQHEKLAVNARSTPGWVLRHSRNPARCQRTTVSGVTTRRDFFQSDQNRHASTQKSLSKGKSVGLACLRFSTASC